MPAQRYPYHVKVKTSVTLPKDLLKQIKQFDVNQSAFSGAHRERLQREKRDVEIINANADRLNAEAREVLDYQRLP
jgi:post-segregation antitoxin (ccd killing protein)